MSLVWVQFNKAGRTTDPEGPPRNIAPVWLQVGTIVAIEQTYQPEVTKVHMVGGRCFSVAGTVAEVLALIAEAVNG